MRAEVVAMTGECLNHEALKRAGEILKNGGLVAFPTETVYGLGPFPVLSLRFGTGCPYLQYERSGDCLKDVPLLHKSFWKPGDSMHLLQARKLFL